MEHVKDVVKRAMVITQLRMSNKYRSMEDHVYDALMQGSGEYQLLNLDRKAEVVGEIVTELMDYIKDRNIINLATTIMERK